MAFSGDSGHQKVQTDLLILKCISTGNSKVAGDCDILSPSLQVSSEVTSGPSDLIIPRVT